MRIGIYAIAKNEAAQVEGFMRACAGADIVSVLDTGSADDTAGLLARHGAVVHHGRISPWRFDLARNVSMALLPGDLDVCLSLDLDERLGPGWRAPLEAAWRPEHDRLRVRFSHAPGSTATGGTLGMKDRGHRRDGYAWRYRAHETLMKVTPEEERICSLPGLLIEHHQDRSKERGGYLALMEADAAEQEMPPRHQFWLARELVWAGRGAEAAARLQAMLALEDVWPVERCHAELLLASVAPTAQTKLLAVMRACQAAPGQREPWFQLSLLHIDRKEWSLALVAIKQALAIVNRPAHYLVSADAWGWRAYDVAALCHYKLGELKEARESLRIALRLSPANPKLLHSAKVIGLDT